MGDLARRLLLLEETAVKSEERLAISATNLAKTSIYADQSVKDQHAINEVGSGPNSIARTALAVFSWLINIWLKIKSHRNNFPYAWFPM